jgi:hypothetical protein
VSPGPSSSSPGPEGAAKARKSRRASWFKRGRF